jgi:hypothetical protein
MKSKASMLKPLAFELEIMIWEPEICEYVILTNVREIACFAAAKVDK